jgi:hypothetical protein
MVVPLQETGVRSQNGSSGVRNLKKQSQRPGAALPACGGWAKKQSETLAIRSHLPADDGPEKTKPAPWCDAACLWWWLGPKKQSETLGMRGRLPTGGGPEKTNRR